MGQELSTVLRELPQADTTGQAQDATDRLSLDAVQALSDAMHNAVTNQQQTNITAQAATTMGVATLYSLDTASTGLSTKEILDGAPSAKPQEAPAPVA